MENVGRGTRTIPRSIYRDGGECSTLCTFWQRVPRVNESLSRRWHSLRVLENLHSPKAGLDEGRVATDGQARRRRLWVRQATS